MEYLPIPKLTESNLAHFWNKVNVRGPEDCWEWIAGTSSTGYGTFGLNGSLYKAHRISYAIAYGDPGEICVCHKHDNPLCVNPAHLWIGTVPDNNQDKIDKNRQAKGEQHGEAKLTEEQVKEILESDEIQENLAEHYSVDPSNISLIKCGKIWKHLEGGCDFKPKTGVQGVTLYKGRFMARITFKGKRLYLGTFDTIEEAKQVLDIWKAKHV